MSNPDIDPDAPQFLIFISERQRATLIAALHHWQHIVWRDSLSDLNTAYATNEGQFERLDLIQTDILLDDIVTNKGVYE